MLSHENLKLDASLFEKLPDSEKNLEFIAVESKTFLRDTWERFKQNKLALFGLYFVVFIVILAIFTPFISRYSYETQNLQNRNAMPSSEHLFGTDKLGRDIFIRVMYGARISLSIGFASAAINLFIGIIYGGIAGYVGGKIDMLMMRTVDIIYSVPSLLYVILILMVFGNNITSMLIAISITSWVNMARQVRTQVMALKETEFAMAAKVIGASNIRILLKHLIINAMGPIIVSLTMMIPQAIFTESFLSFLGIGISQPQSSWGVLASEARGLIHTYPLQIIWPIAAMGLTILSLNFIGDGIGEALEPGKKGGIL